MGVLMGAYLKAKKANPPLGLDDFLCNLPGSGQAEGGVVQGTDGETDAPVSAAPDAQPDFDQAGTLPPEPGNDDDDIDELSGGELDDEMLDLTLDDMMDAF